MAVACLTRGSCCPAITANVCLAGHANSAMLEWVIGKISDALNWRGKTLKGGPILALGISCKKNMDDMGKSPSVEIMEILRAKGSGVSHSDPHVPMFPRIREHVSEIRSAALLTESVPSFDCAVIAANYDKFDCELVRRDARLIVDTCGVYSIMASNIVKA